MGGGGSRDRRGFLSPEEATAACLREGPLRDGQREVERWEICTCGTTQSLEGCRWGLAPWSWAQGARLGS